MALGEYVSVSSQRDTERALLVKELAELAESPEQELDELTARYTAEGPTVGTARKVAQELTANDAFAAHADVELRIDPEALTNPWHAAGASAIAFQAYRVARRCDHGGSPSTGGCRRVVGARCGHVTGW